MPKPHTKANPKKQPKNQPNKSKLKEKPSEPINITKSKFYWISLTVVTFIGVLGYGLIIRVPIANLFLILVTALSVIGLIGYVRLKTSSLTAKTRATYLFVGAAVIGYGIWAAMVLSLAVTGIGAKSPSFLGSQLFIVATQIIFLVVGALIGEYLSTNGKFQVFAGKIKQRL